MSEKAKFEIASENLIRAFIQFGRIRLQKNSKKFDQDSFPHDLKHSETMMLFELGEIANKYPNGISISELSNYLNVTPPSITQVISGLEKKGMLERTMDTTDRRIIRVKLKDTGINFIEKNRRHMVASIQELVEYLGEEKSSQLASLIDEVYQYASEHKRTKI